MKIGKRCVMIGHQRVWMTGSDSSSWEVSVVLEFILTAYPEVGKYSPKQLCVHRHERF